MSVFRSVRFGRGLALGSQAVAVGVCVLPLCGLLAVALPATAAAAPAQGRAKYYFAVAEVKSDVPVDDQLQLAAKEVLNQDLAARPEFTSDLGGTTGEALAAELKRRNLKGFNVSLKLVSIAREPKPPKPGGRLKQLEVSAKVAVFGTTIPEAKLAFGGDGEAIVEAEIVERRLDEEAAALTKDALTQAVRQAVDQAIGKLGERPSKPFNESKMKRKKATR